MAIPLLRVIQNFGRKEFPHPRGHYHLMLAGISQSLFRKNWGEPDSRVAFRKLGNLDERGSLYLTVDSDDEADYSVWIYKTRDRVLFFARRKLIVHFKWSGFLDRQGGPDETREADGMRISPAFLSQTLALVA